MTDEAATKEKFGCRIEYTVIQTSGIETDNAIYCKGLNVQQKGRSRAKF